MNGGYQGGVPTSACGGTPGHPCPPPGGRTFSLVGKKHFGGGAETRYDPCRVIDARFGIHHLSCFVGGYIMEMASK
jgi:hypothetical protein